jgi:hypothetical protein
MAPLSNFEHNAFARVVFQKELYFAIAHDVDGVAGVTVIVDDFARGKSHYIEFRRQFGALVLVEQMEQWYFLQQIGIRLHGRRMIDFYAYGKIVPRRW